MRASAHYCDSFSSLRSLGGLRAPNCKSTRSFSRLGSIQVKATAIPGPLFMSIYDRDRYLGDANPRSFVQFPVREVASTKRTPPLVRVRLSVEYRVHSRQMLCVGGSAIPFGWSFLSIAKVPMSWQPVDIWTVDVELPAGTRLEYKYVILEEQNWTQQVNEASEGRVEYTYRSQPDANPPDIQHITKQMAIVGWQSGPNRMLQVPTEAELQQLRVGTKIERIPTKDAITSSTRSYGQQALGRDRLSNIAFPPPQDPSVGPPSPEELLGMWEILSVDESGQAMLDRRDVWGKPPETLP